MCGNYLLISWELNQRTSRGCNPNGTTNTWLYKTTCSPQLCACLQWIHVMRICNDSKSLASREGRSQCMTFSIFVGPEELDQLETHVATLNLHKRWKTKKRKKIPTADHQKGDLAKLIILLCWTPSLCVPFFQICSKSLEDVKSITFSIWFKNLNVKGGCSAFEFAGKGLRPSNYSELAMWNTKRRRLLGGLISIKASAWFHVISEDEDDLSKKNLRVSQESRLILSGDPWLLHHVK